jgi:hypothetical protein
MRDNERRRRQLAASAVASALILLLVVVGSYTYIFILQRGKPQEKIATEPEDVSICQLLKDPGKYNQKLVKVTAFFSLGFEDAGVYDLQCDSRFGIWYDFGGTSSTGTMYCCGVVPSRTRPEQVTIENISIPLLADEKFQAFDRLLRDKGILRANVIGRFFSGEKSTAPNGRVWWGGYGHMGCCSLFMIQQVVNSDDYDRQDVDYGSSIDESDISKSCDRYEILFDSFQNASLIEAQRAADTNDESWMFEDPRRIAREGLAKLIKCDPASIQALTLKRQTQGRMVFQWKPKNERALYTAVVSRPYELSFYAKTNRVVWVLREAYRSTCR